MIGQTIFHYRVLDVYEQGYHDFALGPRVRTAPTCHGARSSFRGPSTPWT